ATNSRRYSTSGTGATAHVMFTVLFSVGNAIADITIGGLESRTNVNQAVALADRVFRRLTGAPIPAGPAFSLGIPAFVPAAPTARPPIVVAPPSGGSSGRTEWVYVHSIDDSHDTAIIERANGELWLIEKGVGCLGLWRYEEKNVLILSPGLFAGVSSQIILPDGSGQCRIWDSKELH
ncbi:MAG TPA: hypothetical protein VHS28_08655, partial [Chloroflexota bacterium]|nr:hypothetical protein [Chloroflexota bacterium]